MGGGKEGREGCTWVDVGSSQNHFVKSCVRMGQGTSRRERTEEWNKVKLGKREECGQGEMYVFGPVVLVPINSDLPFQSSHLSRSARFCTFLHLLHFPQTTTIMIHSR